MGILFSVLEKTPIEPDKLIIKETIQPSIKEIIERYEYIKETKMILDINTILDIIKNTDWDKIEPEYAPVFINPTAPLPTADPIK
jgi:hypothetical protein